MNLQQRLLTAVLALALFVVSIPAVAAETKTVNINTATAAEFQLLPRVGPAVAARIVEQREKNGPFKALDDILLVRGIGDATYEQLKPYLALSGATTLTEKVKLPRPPKGEKATTESADRRAAND